MATFSLDLRQRILASYDQGDGTRDQIARRFCVSLGMVKKLLQQRWQHPPTMPKVGLILWIGMKANREGSRPPLEKVNGLAADIQLFLADKPVTAQAPSACYRLLKTPLELRACPAPQCDGPFRGLKAGEE